MDIQRYNIRLLFRPGKQIIYADAMSRCPMKTDSTALESEEVRVIRTLPMRDTTTRKICEVASTDNIDQELMEITRKGWPDSKKRLNHELSEYFPHRDQLTVEDDLVLRGNAVVVPRQLINFDHRYKGTKKRCGPERRQSER